jgi:hypothetical protein
MHEFRGPLSTEEISKRVKQLSAAAAKSKTQKFTALSDEINQIRTIKLNRIVPGTANADFFIVLERDPESSTVKVNEVKYISGSKELISADKALMSAQFKFKFPDDSQARILRRGTLGCYAYAGCSFTLLLPEDVHSVN